MSEEEITIYATVERTASGKMIVDVKSERYIPTYTGLTKAVRNCVNLDKLLEIDDLPEEFEIGTVCYDTNKGHVESSDIKVTSLNSTVERHCSI